jgi:hypothetical protein
VKRTREELVAAFKAIGASYPDARADAEVDENQAALASALFLKEAWAAVYPDDAKAPWIDSWVDDAVNRPDGPCAGGGHALGRMLKLGVRRSDIVDLIRAAQYETLFGLCQLLEDGPDSDIPAVGGVSWSVFETDAEGSPTRPLTGLHEEVLSADPTGREMRPRPRRSGAPRRRPRASTSRKTRRGRGK